ncbi:MAG: DUF4349 domain-containing protein [Chloroflexi bacterium]|nr:DUF4349 domain-containing protein [Chloroflexota bacterium]
MLKGRLFPGAAALLVLALFVGCAPSAPQPSAPPGATGPAGPAGERGQAGLTLSLPSSEQRLLVRKVNMALMVRSVQETADRVIAMATRLGGFLVRSEVEQETQQASISIRVPSDRTDEALLELRGLAVKVSSEKQETEDVTEEYVDLQAQLRNLEATETQLLSIMKEARTISDTLQVQRELTSVQSEIERRKGRIQFLERSSSMSLITVTLFESGGQRPLVVEGWSFVDTVKDALRALVVVAQGVATLAVWAFFFIPFWAAIIAVVYFLRRRRRPAAAPPAAMPPAQPPAAPAGG